MLRLMLLLSCAATPFTLASCDCDCHCCDRRPEDTRHCCGGSSCGECCFQRGIPVATFDNRANHSWTVESDPVMGGKSTSKWQLGTTPNGTSVGVWEGECRIVPSLKAPGFTFTMTESIFSFSFFPSVISADGLEITMQNVEGNVTLFQVAFCDSRINPYRCQFGTYKANFTLPPAPMKDFQTAFVPWSAFSDKWSPATGQHTAEDPPTEEALGHVTQVQLWVEGVVGSFKVYVEGIRAKCHTPGCY